MARSFAYPVELIPEVEAGGYVVRRPDFPEVVTQGETEAEALAAAADALEEAVAGRIKRREDIPRPSPRSRGQGLAALSPAMAAKAALHLAARGSGLSNSAVARKLGLDEKEVRRRLDPRYRSGLDKITAALGKRLTVQLSDA